MPKRLTRFSLFIGVLLAAGIAAILLIAPPTDNPPENIPAQIAPDAVRIEIGEDIQVVIDSNPPGTTFLLAGGIHRMQTITPRDNDILIGEDGAVLSGARVLETFEHEGSYWVAANQTQQGRRAHNNCYSDYPRCYYPEDLFFDDQPFRHVTSLDELVPGTWYFDYEADRVYIVDNPNGRNVEISVTTYGIGGTATGVIIRDLTVEKFANPAQQGAIHAAETTDWVLYNLTIRLNHGSGLRVGNGTQLLESRILTNGQLGVGGSGSDIRIEGNEIAGNNFAGYRSTWEAGGTKFVQTTGLVVRNNYVHDNDGPGLWTDFDNHDVLYEDNIVMYNQRNGIYHEISGSATIRDNIVKFNGLNYDNWLWGSQILVSSSSDVEVLNNYVVVDGQIGNGIGIVNQNRDNWRSYNNYVHDNTIVHLGESGSNGTVTDFDNEQFWGEANNRFDHNTYYVTSELHHYWTWDDRSWTWGEFQAHGQEAHGNLIVGDIPDDASNVPEWTVNIPPPS